MYQPELAPLGSLWLSALVAMLPLATVFVGLGVLKWKAHIAGLVGLAVAVAVAVFAYDMPAGLALNSGVLGFIFGLFPIMWIVFNAIVFYEITVASGRFEDLRVVFNLISDDPRIQAIVIAFCFGALLEALAGFGAPVAITGVMLMAVGFSPLRAATVVLLANTAPVAFGAIGLPILTAGRLTGIDPAEIGAYVGHQTPVIALFVPLFLVLLADGKRGVRDVWPVALTTGAAFAIAQWLSASYLSFELADIVSALAGLLAVVITLRFWQPSGREGALARLQAEADAQFSTLATDQTTEVPQQAPATGATAVATEVATEERLSGGRIFMALFPYLLVIVVFSLAKLWAPLRDALAATDVPIEWPGLYGNVLNLAGEPSSSTIYNFTWLSNPGTLLLICTVIAALVFRVRPGVVLRTYGFNAHKMRFSFLTVASVLALAYVMNLSGMTLSIGTWIAGTGAAFAFLSPILGWVGTAVTGSDTSANALFATLQQTAAQNAGLDPTLLVAANTSGGVVGKMISPQNLTIAATAVGLLGRESEILRRVLPWSIGLLVGLCLLVGLQSTPILSWMLP